MSGKQLLHLFRIGPLSARAQRLHFLAMRFAQRFDLRPLLIAQSQFIHHRLTARRPERTALGFNRGNYRYTQSCNQQVDPLLLHCIIPLVCVVVLEPAVFLLIHPLDTDNADIHSRQIKKTARLCVPFFSIRFSALTALLITARRPSITPAIAHTARRPSIAPATHHFSKAPIAIFYTRPLLGVDVGLEFGIHRINDRFHRIAALGFQGSKARHRSFYDGTHALALGFVTRFDETLCIPHKKTCVGNMAQSLARVPPHAQAAQDNAQQQRAQQNERPFSLCTECHAIPPSRRPHPTRWGLRQKRPLTQSLLRQRARSRSSC